MVVPPPFGGPSVAEVGLDVLPFGQNLGVSGPLLVEIGQFRHKFG